MSDMNIDGMTLENQSQMTKEEDTESSQEPEKDKYIGVRQSDIDKLTGEGTTVKICNLNLDNLTRLHKIGEDKYREKRPDEGDEMYFLSKLKNNEFFKKEEAQFEAWF